MGVPRSHSGLPRSTENRVSIAQGKTSEPVVVVRLGQAAAEQTRNVPGRAAPGAPHRDRPGIRIANTDYLVTVSEEAARRDSEVRGHETAHLAALGGYAESGVILDHRTGPDGRSYAVGGRIGVDLSEVPGDPRATLRKARTVMRAANAPGNPSIADARVASEAYRLAQKAAREINTSQVDEFA